MGGVQTPPPPPAGGGKSRGPAGRGLTSFSCWRTRRFYDVASVILRTELHYNSYGKVASDDLIAAALALSPVKRILIESLSSHARAEDRDMTMGHCMAHLRRL